MRLDMLRIKAFPFGAEIAEFCATHERIFVVEQNRDAQMRSLLILEAGADAEKLIPVLNYDGMPLTAEFVRAQVLESAPAAAAAAE